MTTSDLGGARQLSISKANNGKVFEMSQKSSAREKTLNDVRAKILIAGIAVEERTLFHFKYGALNFFPTKGTIHRDGNLESYRATGVDAFITACQNEDLGIVEDPADD